MGRRLRRSILAEGCRVHAVLALGVGKLISKMIVCDGKERHLRGGWGVWSAPLHDSPDLLLLRASEEIGLSNLGEVRNQWESYLVLRRQEDTSLFSGAPRCSCQPCLFLYIVDTGEL